MELKNSGLLQFQCFINNNWIYSKEKKTFNVTNPATGEIIIAVADAGIYETE